MVAGEQLFLILLVVAAFAAVAWFVYQHEKKRAQQLEAAARSLGLSFSKNASQDVRPLVGQVDAMPHGNSRNARFLIQGTYQGLAVRVFQYTYQTGSGKNRQTHRNSIAVAELPTQWPRLTIVPEHVGHKLFDALGGDDIDFESDEFSRRYWVRCKDRKFAYDIVHGRMMEHLMDAGWQRWEIRGSLIVLWDQNTRLKPAHIQPSLDRIVRFVGLVPSFLRPDPANPRPTTVMPR